MQDPTKQRTHFWIGNGMLAAALATLFFLDPLSELLGIGAMVLWMALAGVGMYFIMLDKGPKTDHLD
ncbi:MAG: hypothetical protein WC474_00240 [Hydrogenophilaceae bacterium]